MHQEEAINEDHFFTIKKNGEGFYKEKGSKFLGYAYHVSSVDEVTEKLNELKAKYHDARHFCFAYRINPEKPEVRANDDGEPSNSAGAPIYNQILSHELWNCLVVVVRYFGGTKLGVSGLVGAYKEAASEALKNSKIVEEYLIEEILIKFPYSQMNDVMRIIKDMEVSIIKENMGLNGEYLLGVRKSDYQLLTEKLGAFHLIEIL